MITLGFHGAAGTVTGSKYLITAGTSRVLIDGGLFQGGKELRERNWKDPVFDSRKIDAILLTHAHIDHIGYLPRLRKLGFDGPIYATAPTIDIAKLSLRDTASLQQEDADYRNRKGLSRHTPALPLFTEEDVAEVEGLFREVSFDRWTKVTDNIRFRCHLAGHLLGAASLEVEVSDASLKRTILFSGDIGRFSNPLTVPPSPPPQCDYLVCESTYGGRLHPEEDPIEELDAVITEVVRKKGILVIPAFAIGRTQQLVYVMNRLIQEREVPPIPIHVDSPMAVSATEIYCRYPEYHNLPSDQLSGDQCMIEGRYVHFHRTRRESMKLNEMSGPAVIISASGMMTGGRILHHLLNRAGDPNNTIALVGFMAEGTPGRALQDGEKELRIHKQPLQVRAKVVQIAGFSGHGDYNELLQWLEPMNKPKQVFLTHGEASMLTAFSEHLQESRQWPSHIPVMDETFELT